MDILLVSGRSDAGVEHPSVALAERLVRELAQRGHRGTHLRAGGAAPDARQVQARLADPELEIALAKALRTRLPSVVHVLAFAGASSAQTAWLASRMGAAVVVSACPKAVLCQRGTLVDANGEVCFVHDDARRCAWCCALPARAVLELENRRDLVLGGLAPADLVLVRDAAERDLLVAAGLPEKQVRVVPEPDVDVLLEIYGAVAASPPAR